MRFAITACDRYLGVFEAFLDAGWEPVKLFSVPATNVLDANGRAVALAKQHGIDIQMSRMSQADLHDLHMRGCEALIVASYNWRIGDWRPHMKYAVNFHPSPLPLARGPYPMVRAILEARSSWAMSCHKLEPEFDAGDILAAENFALDSEECHESLNLKLQMAGGRLAHPGRAQLRVDCGNRRRPRARANTGLVLRLPNEPCNFPIQWRPFCVNCAPLVHSNAMRRPTTNKFIYAARSAGAKLIAIPPAP